MLVCSDFSESAFYGRSFNWFAAAFMVVRLGPVCSRQRGAQTHLRCLCLLSGLNVPRLVRTRNCPIHVLRPISLMLLEKWDIRGGPNKSPTQAPAKNNFVPTHKSDKWIYFHFRSRNFWPTRPQTPASSPSSVLCREEINSQINSVNKASVIQITTLSETVFMWWVMGFFLLLLPQKAHMNAGTWEGKRWE